MSRYFADDRLEALLSNARLVVFDMNGLIIDDERFQLAAANEALRRVVPKAAGLRDRIDEEYWKRRCIGRKTERFFAEILHDRGLSADAGTIERLIAEKNACWARSVLSSPGSLLRPGVAELLDHLGSSGRHETALATSALPEEVEAVLGASGLGLKERFRFIACGADTANAKPDPEIFLLLSRRSGVPPSECLVLEDSETGVEAAARARMPCIACPNTFTAGHDFSGASFVVDSLRPEARIVAP